MFCSDIVCTPLFVVREVEPLPNFQQKKRGGVKGLTGSQFLEGACWEKGVDVFSGRLRFLHKKKLKSEVFSTKKSLQTKMFFSAINFN